MTPPIEKLTTYDSANRELTGPSSKKRTLPENTHKFIMCLLQSPNKLVPIEAFWDIFPGSKSQVRVYATKLRKIFEIIDPSLSIVNKYGEGYTLKGTIKSI